MRHLRTIAGILLGLLFLEALRRLLPRRDADAVSAIRSFKHAFLRRFRYDGLDDFR